MSDVFLTENYYPRKNLFDQTNIFMQYMECLEHKFFDREQNTKLNVVVVKNCFTRKEDCDSIIELRTAIHRITNCHWLNYKPLSINERNLDVKLQFTLYIKCIKRSILQQFF